jgi:hypothetical protein
MLTYLPMTTILTQSVWIIIDWWDSQNISVGAQSWHYIIIVSWLTTSVHILSKNVCRATISLRQLAVHSLQYVRHNYYGHTMFTVWMCVGHRPRSHMVDMLHTPCIPIIIVHTLFSCTHLHVEHHREFEHSHALHTYRQPLCVQETV